MGALNLDGKLSGAERPLVRDLPTSGRLWWPPEQNAGEQPVLTIVDVADLSRAWEALLNSNEIERALAMQQ